MEIHKKKVHKYTIFGTVLDISNPLNWNGNVQLVNVFDYQGKPHFITMIDQDKHIEEQLKNGWLWCCRRRCCCFSLSIYVILSDKAVVWKSDFFFCHHLTCNQMNGKFTNESISTHFLYSWESRWDLLSLHLLFAQRLFFITLNEEEDDDEKEMKKREKKNNWCVYMWIEVCIL